MAVIGPFSFRDGYCPGYDFYALPQEKQYATTLSNMRVRNGYASLRWGSRHAVTSDTTGGILGMKIWTDTANGKVALVLTSGASKLWIGDITSFDPDTSNITFTDYTGALAAASLSSTYTNFDSLNAMLIGSANSASSGVLFKVTAYNANGAALGGSPPNADIVKQCNNFLFISRNLSSSTTQSKVYWSNVNDPETWTAANVLDFNKNDGEPIMALGSIGTDLYIFKQTSIGRLSTVTISVSGAVTLGPLVTVIRGIGCCGPRALDNLPNGNIVFWGYDGHFYEFDGSTVIDRSQQPYPNPDVYNQSRWSATSTVRDMGLKWMNNNTAAVVRVNASANEVYVLATSTAVNDNASTIMVYDFEQGIWQGDCGNSGGSGNIYAGNIMDFLYIPTGANASPKENNQAMFFNDGSRVAVSGIRARPYPFDPTDNGAPPNGSAIPAHIGRTFSLMTQNGPFVPMSICIETSQTQASNATLATFTVKADYDTYLPSTTVYTGTAGAVLPNRIVIPLTHKPDTAGTNVFPAYLSVLISCTGQGSTNTIPPEILRIGNIWLSDEVIR